MPTLPGLLSRIAVPGLLGVIGVAATITVQELPQRIATIALTLAGVGLPLIVDERKGRDRQRQERREALLALLDAPWIQGSESGTAAASNWASLLLPRMRIARFLGRAGEMAELHDFLASGDAICLVSGPAGSGKTRLVEEWARELPTTNISGWVRARSGERAIDLALGVSDQVLLLVEGLGDDTQ